MTPLAEASAEIRQVRDWLMRPSAETLEACGPALERATAQLAEVLRNPPDPSLWTAAIDLAKEVLQCQALLASAGQLYFGRLRQLSDSLTE